MEQSEKLSRVFGDSTKFAALLQKRVKFAQEEFVGRVQNAYSQHATEVMTKPLAPLDFYEYAMDFAQRSVLFLDTLRQRGNNFIEHNRRGLPPLLHFDSAMELDGRTLERPVNYALLKILPPAGVQTDPKRRPYVIIDPRAGHGPGIGGFKDDSQVGVALQDGHPVYFVIFFREPEPGQTLLDVCVAEQQFVRRVRELHPHSPKPAIVGNCQGGWAAMMLAASDPDQTGPIVVNGAPMSYWGGALKEGAGDNPMRYSGGLLGGTWLSSFAADLGNGKFDGASLVDNFENLNPANTYWDKYYNLFSKADTEAPRFLEFERWWGGFFLMNREEIEWITRNLFVGNKLWTGETRAWNGKAFDLRDIKAPIVLFASMGDNITPPQQAFNWVADIYGSTEEIKARGQVIVGLLHEDIGHLGIFVSGKVAKKEHKQIVSVLKSIELLPPGLYGMQIHERKAGGGKTEYDVEFHERRLEDVIARLNRAQRADEKPFEAVAAVSEFNQRAYELFARPLIQAMANDATAELARQMAPIRAQRWAISDLNPFLWWVGPAAQMVKAQRQALGPEAPLRQGEKLVAELVSASLDYYRAMRDAASEAMFFQTYGTIFSLYHADMPETRQGAAGETADPLDLPVVKDALASLEEGGYAEAVARVGVLLSRSGEPMPLARLNMRQDLAQDYKALIPDLPLDQWRRVRGRQEIIVRYEPERAIATLPELLADRDDRERLLTLMEKMVGDARVQRSEPTAAQQAMYERIRRTLLQPAAPRPRLSPVRRA
jgi:pimeloyl-ACP methyl ester carboxylesterase